MQERMTSDKGRDYAIRLHLPQGDPPERGHALVWLLDNASAFARSLRRRGVDCTFELIEGETHASVIPPAMSHALQFARDETFP